MTMRGLMGGPASSDQPGSNKVRVLLCIVFVCWYGNSALWKEKKTAK